MLTEHDIDEVLHAMQQFCRQVPQVREEIRAWQGKPPRGKTGQFKRDHGEETAMLRTRAGMLSRMLRTLEHQ